MIQKIENLNDVGKFMHDLVKEGINAHPDERFENYININTEEPTYHPEEAALRNHLMEKCFEICEKEDVDIYSFMQGIFLKETGLDKFIPFPTEA